MVQRSSIPITIHRSFMNEPLSSSVLQHAARSSTTQWQFHHLRLHSDRFDDACCGFRVLVGGLESCPRQCRVIVAAAVVEDGAEVDAEVDAEVEPSPRSNVWLLPALAVPALSQCVVPILPLKSRTKASHRKHCGCVPLPWRGPMRPSAWW